MGGTAELDCGLYSPAVAYVTSWAANHGCTYVNLGALMDLTLELKQIFIDTSHEAGFNPGPEQRTPVLAISPTTHGATLYWRPLSDNVS